MTTLLGVLIVVFSIVASVVAHEYGHYKTAKLFGMKVTQFFVGMGSTIFSWRRGETEYGLKALPIGGFVRIVGQSPIEELTPEDEAKAMYRQPLGRRAIVMSAGSAMHFLIATVVAVGVFAGFKQYSTTTTVGSVEQCLLVGNEKTCPESADPTPAVLAGLKAGDEIIAVDGVRTPSWGSLHSAIASHSIGQLIELRVQRGNQQLVLSTHTVASPPATDSKGNVLPAKDQPKPYAIVGFAPAQVGHRENPIKATGSALSFFWEATTRTFTTLIHLPSKLPALLHPQQQKDSGLHGVYGAAQVGGDLAKHHDYGDLLLLVASLNISFGVLNLFPLLPLDGGHLAIMYFERARSAISRRMRRPDPGMVDPMKLFAPTVTVAGFLFLVFVLVLIGDIVHHPAA